MHIESYNFGRMVVDGTAYTSDLIIYPDGTILSSWWRKKGHSLSREDITDLIEQKPEYLVAGTGTNGIMVPQSSLPSYLEQQGITFKPEPTTEAVTTFNQLRKKGHRVGGCFHLTC